MAFMLFTPGPDEAVEPIIVGLAATILILASQFKEWIAPNDPARALKTAEVWLLWPIVCIALLVCAMALLFVIRDKFLKDEEEVEEKAK